MVKFVKAFFLALSLMVFLASCSSPATQQVNVNNEKQITPGYPAVEQPVVATNSYPGPLPGSEDRKSFYPKSVDIPEPKSDLGVITGKMFEKGTNEVYLAPTLILGELAYADDPNAPPLVGFSEETDPKGTQAQDGKFVFADVKPGKYSIVVWTPISQTLVSDGKGNTVLITVEPGKVTDLGDVFVP